LMLLEQQNKKRLMMARTGQLDSTHQDTGQPETDTSPAPDGQENQENTTSDDISRTRQENTTSEDIPHTHHTISEDQTASSGFMRDKLYALDPNSDQPQPAPASQPPQPQNQKQPQAPIKQKAHYQQVIKRDTSSPKFQRQTSQQADNKQETRRSNPIRSLAVTAQHIDSNRTTTSNIASTIETPLSRSEDGIRNHSAEEEGSKGDPVKKPGTTAPLGDTNLLQQLRQRIQELEDEISKIRAGKTEAKLEDATQINVQVFHCLTESRDEIVYLSEPDWETHDGEVILKGRFPVPDPEGYVERKGNVAFIVYKFYNVEHQRVSVDSAMKTKQPLPDPEPVRQDVLLSSDEMIAAVNAFLAQYPTFRTEYPEVHTSKLMAGPFIWWYHYRKSYNVQFLPHRPAHLMVTLIDWIERNYAPLYDQIDNQFRRGRVSNASMEYLVRPGDVLISISEGVPMGNLATSRPFPINKPKLSLPGPNDLLGMSEQHQKSHHWRWSVMSYSYTYAGHFSQNDMTLTLDFETETEDGEIDISSLGVVPLEYASREVRERLERRGKTFWKCRNKQLVSYEGTSTAKWKYAVRSFHVYLFPLSCFPSTYLK